MTSIKLRKLAARLDDQDVFPQASQDEVAAAVELRRMAAAIDRFQDDMNMLRSTANRIEKRDREIERLTGEPERAEYHEADVQRLKANELASVIFILTGEPT